MSNTLCFLVDSIDENGTATISVYEDRTKPALILTTKTQSGTTTTSDVDLSCLTNDSVSKVEIESECISWAPADLSDAIPQIAFFDAADAVLGPPVAFSQRDILSFTDDMVPSAAADYDHFRIGIAVRGGVWRSEPLRMDDDFGSAIVLTYQPLQGPELPAI